MKVARRALAELVKELSWDERGLGLRRERVRVAPNEAVATLSEWFYQRLFTRWQPSRGRWADDVAGAPHFVDRLVARAGGATYLDEGFEVWQRTPTGVFARNDFVRLWVENPADLTPSRARVGEAVRVRLPCARESAVPGFFTVVSRAGRIADTAHLKLYLNVTPEGALELVDGLVHEKALRRARFEAKVVNDPDGYGRRDTALLYVAPSSWSVVTAWLAGFHRRRAARRLFRPGTPPMTLELARGVAAAESPLGDESFGEHRCRLIAEGVVEALRTKTRWHDTVAARFVQEKLRFEAPWLGTLHGGWVDRTPRRWV